MCQLIALIGGSTASHVITFSEPVQDPVMDILSLGSDFHRLVRHQLGASRLVMTTADIRTGKLIRVLHHRNARRGTATGM